MAKKKVEKFTPEIPLVEEDLTAPKATLAGPTAAEGDKEMQWASIETETARVKDAFITGTVSLNEAIDDLIASLGTLKAEEKPGLPGLGGGPEMRFPEELPAGRV